MTELINTSLTFIIGATTYAVGVFTGIRLYKHVIQPFLDLTPMSPEEEEELYNPHIEEDGFNWSDYDNYIENKLKEDTQDDDANQ